MGDDALTEFFGLYMGGALELYLAAKDGARSFGPFGIAQMPFAASNAFVRLMSGWGARAERQDEVAELRRELEEIKEALKRRADEE